MGLPKNAFLAGRAVRVQKPPGPLTIAFATPGGRLTPLQKFVDIRPPAYVSDILNLLRYLEEPGLTNLNARRGCLLLACAGILAVPLALTQGAPQSYYEFGTVVAFGRGTVDLQTFDQQLQRTVQHSFVLAKGSRVEVLHAGDAVEVIYVPTGPDWVIRNLVVLSAGIPRQGAPAGQHASSAPAAVVGSAGPGKAIPKAGSVALPTATANTRAGRAGNIALPTQTASNQRASTSGNVAVVDLGGSATRAVPGIVSVPLGADPSALPTAPRIKTVTHADPIAECNRGDAGWPDQPISIAILDFRYPTEKEESHDIGTTGGGSGTAVADLVLERLSAGQTAIAYSRGDRDKLYRADFAGAARVGRRLGVDAVLAGTFQPVEQPLDKDGFVPPPIYELRAGLVDTCTGQLLERLSSAICPGGIDTGGTQSGCKRVSVTAKQASDPKETRTAFTPALDALLLPLEHEGTPPGQKGSAGLVSAVEGNQVTIQLAPGTRQKAGDLIALHAWRLGKNTSTYTLHRLQDEEIGRVNVDSVSGSTAKGTFAGDFAPRVGDTAESVTE